MKYLTFSYDDGVTQDRRLIDIFKKYGMKATFNLNSGSLGNCGRINHQGFDVSFDKISAEEVATLYNPDDGFEVAVHGVQHKNLTSLNEKEFELEILTDRQNLEKLWGHPVMGGAYACGYFDDNCDELLKKCGLCYYRTIKDTHTFDIPENFNYWHPTCHDNYEGIFDLAEQFISYKGPEDKVFYIWGHSFELDKDDRDRWGNMEKLCSMLSGKNDICYVTNAMLFKAIKA